MRRLSERMLLTVGVAMTLLSVTIAAGVAAAVGLHGEKSSAPTGLPSTEFRAAKEMKEVKRKYNPGKKLEIDREPVEEPLSKRELPPVEPPPPPPLPPPPPPPPAPLPVELPPPLPPSVPEHAPQSTKPVQKHQPQPAPKPPPTKGQKVLEEAQRYMGVRYRIGGASRSGVDCSGLTMLAYKKFGVSLPHHVKKQYQYGYWVRGEPKAGDLVFFDEHGKGISHVGIATGRGTIIHASNYWKRVTETKIKYIKGYKGAKRLL